MKESENHGKIFIILLFLLTLAYFLYQHHCSMFWDYAAYSLNAKHILGQTEYFEWMRPIFYPFLMSFFYLFGKAGESFFIMITLGLFFIFSCRLAQILKLKKEIFLLFLLQPIFFIYGFSEGTEVLSSLLFMIFLIIFLQKKTYSGFFLGLAAITRYNLLYFFPILFFQKKIKNIFFSLIFSFIPIAAWLLINYFFTGNLFTSIADNLAINNIYREITNPIRWDYIALLFGFYILLSLGYLKNKLRKPNFINQIFSKTVVFRKEFVMVLIIILTLIPFFFLPLRIIRYLFILIIPLAYFSSKFYITLKNKKIKYSIIVIALIIFGVSLYTNHFICTYSFEGVVERNVDILQDQKLDGFQYMSNAWVHLNYYGVQSVPAPSIKALDYYLFSGNRVLLFKAIYFDDITDLKKINLSKLYPVLYENNEIIILGIEEINHKSLEMDKTFMENKKKDFLITGNRTVITDPCNVLFNSKITGLFCSLVNLQKINPEPNEASEYMPLPKLSSDYYKGRNGENPDLKNKNNYCELEDIDCGNDEVRAYNLYGNILLPNSTGTYKYLLKKEYANNTDKLFTERYFLFINNTNLEVIR